MKMFLMAAILSLTTTQNPVQFSAVIEGSVLRAGTMEPIAGAKVTLVAGASTPTSDQAAEYADRLQEVTRFAGAATTTSNQVTGTIQFFRTEMEMILARQNYVLTDSAGHFSFKVLTPGKYTVGATRDGFVGPPIWNGSPSTVASKIITVEAQKPVPPVSLLMIQGGIIRGQIRDPNGKPLPGITVAANRVIYSNGRPQWTVVTSKMTDDRGEYKLFWLGPGEYYVGMALRMDSWARTFYPGVSDPGASTSLTIKDGAELTGIDFTVLPLASPGTFKISGKVENPLAGQNPQSPDRGNVDSLTLAPREPGILDSADPFAQLNRRPAFSVVDGAFEIRDVPPGSYDLIASYSGTTPGVSRDYIDRTRVDVRDADVEGVKLEIQKGSEVKGQIISQDKSSVPLDMAQVNFHSRDSIPEEYLHGIATGFNSTGGFSMLDVPVAKYSLEISGLPGNAYVADIRQDGTSIFDEGLTVSRQPQTSIQILVNANGEAIEGTVQTSEHKPAANATVALVPSGIHGQNPMLYKNVRTDDAGHFVLEGIAPGEYSLFAWESVPPTAWMNSEFLAKYQTRGRSVTAMQGAHIQIQLELIPE